MIARTSNNLYWLARDVERADALAHAHTRQFRDNFIDYMKENYSQGFSLAQDRQPVSK